MVCAAVVQQRGRFRVSNAGGALLLLLPPDVVIDATPSRPRGLPLCDGGRPGAAAAAAAAVVTAAPKPKTKRQRLLDSLTAALTRQAASLFRVPKPRRVSYGGGGAAQASAGPRSFASPCGDDDEDGGDENSASPSPPPWDALPADASYRRGRFVVLEENLPPSPPPRGRRAPPPGAVQRRGRFLVSHK
jgi:hypothetical protein